MKGWLVKVTSPGVDPTTRKIVEMWAAWVPDPAEAIAAVEQRSSEGDPPSETLCELSEELLRGAGLTEEGQVARVRCIF
jgi:hypothetical protein